MKKMPGILLASVCLLTAVSCTKTLSPSINLTESQELITDTWKVSNYSENEVSNTDLLIGYTFTFNNDGTLTVSDCTGTYNGTFDLGASDNPSFGTSVDITIEGPEELVFLSRDWDVSKLTDESMRLRYNYSGTYLEFELKKLIIF